MTSFVQIPNTRFLLLGFCSLSLVVGAACSSSTSDDTPYQPPPDDGGATDSATPPPGTDAGDAAPAPSVMTLSYAPAWDGVVSVDVVGAFGQATDWTTPLFSLTKNAAGTFTGTSPTLPTGTYTYLFKVTGDSAAAPAKRATFVRYSLDPSTSSYSACPSTAPTYEAAVMNPCSQTVVPGVGPDPEFHIRGVVVENGAPIVGYLVEIERNETGSHHEFVNRTTTAADGTYDLSVAPGTYRLQVLHPTFLSMTDAQRTDPASLAAVRRTISTDIVVAAADTQVNDAEVSFSTYAAMGPMGSQTLPTTFTFDIPAGAKSHAEIYGPGPTIGDPWWMAPVALATTDVFDGGFNTDKAPDAGLDGSATYAWGVENVYPKPADGGVVGWSAQSMVFPISWP